jgi:hypothetical protein
MKNMRSNREQLEESWKARLDDARLQLDFARSYVREVERGIIQSGSTPARCGQEAYIDALKGEKQAITKYESVLNIFTGLVTCGIFPDGTESADALRPQRQRAGMAAGSE